MGESLTVPRVIQRRKPQLTSNQFKMAKKAGGKKKRTTSNVFSQFEQAQIQEFKEAFQMIDADRNGIITVGDLKATYASLGVRNIDQDMLENMVSEAGAPINFTIYLKIFDPENKGVVHKQYICDVLKSQADRFTPEECEQMLKLASCDELGMLDYKALCYTLTHGSEGDEEEA